MFGVRSGVCSKGEEEGTYEMKCETCCEPSRDRLCEDCLVKEILLRMAEEDFWTEKYPLTKVKEAGA